MIYGIRISTIFKKFKECCGHLYLAVLNIFLFIVLILKYKKIKQYISDLSDKTIFMANKFTSSNKLH